MDSIEIINIEQLQEIKEDEVVEQLQNETAEALETVEQLQEIKPKAKAKRKAAPKKLTKDNINKLMEIEAPAIEAPTIEAPAIETPAIEAPTIEDKIIKKNTKVKCVDCGKLMSEKTLQYSHKHNCRSKNNNVKIDTSNQEQEPEQQTTKKGFILNASFDTNTNLYEAHKQHLLNKATERKNKIVALFNSAI